MVMFLVNIQTKIFLHSWNGVWDLLQNNPVWKGMEGGVDGTKLAFLIAGEIKWWVNQVHYILSLFLFDITLV